eukprot:791550-Lingulodinium_polyedra.AAC.1
MRFGRRNAPARYAARGHGRRGDQTRVQCNLFLQNTPHRRVATNATQCATRELRAPGTTPHAFEYVRNNS